MSGLLTKYIKITVEILLFSLIALIIVYFSGVARTALTEKTERDVIMNEMQTYRELYSYINAPELSGDDIVRFTGLFKRYFDITIVKGGSSYALLAADTTSTAWESQKIIKFLDTDVLKKYTLTYTKDVDSDRLLTVTFTMK